MNWASRDYDPSKDFDWATADYHDYGYAELLDLYTNGNYYPMVTLEEFRPIELPEEDMTFYPLPANHYQIPHEAVFYAIRHGNAWILIGNDTGYYPEETWKWFAEHKIHFDIVISDATFGIRDSRDGHLGGRFILAVKDRLTELNRVNQKTRYIANHFTHNNGSLHEDLENWFRPHGIEVGYDGMVLNY